MSIYFIPIVTLLGAALFRYRSIRALCRPISPCGLNTGFWLRLLPVGQYAFAVALFRPMGSIRALCRPISLSLNTGFWLRLLPVGQYAFVVALFRPMGSIRALCRPGLRYAYPGLYSGAPSGRSISHRQTSHLPAADVNSPSPLMERGAGGEVTG